MKQVDLSKAFYKTKAILIKEGLWPDDDTAPVDYAISNSLIVIQMPDEYDLTFSTDFGASEGVYTDLKLDLWEDGASSPRSVSFGTIKTLHRDRESLACFAALGANFMYYGRREIMKLLREVFPQQVIQYQILSMDVDPMSFTSPCVDPEKIKGNPSVYESNYKLIAKGEFSSRGYPTREEVCRHLLQKARIEMAFCLSETDIIQLFIKQPEGNYPDEPSSYLFEGGTAFSQIDFKNGTDKKSDREVSLNESSNVSH